MTITQNTTAPAPLLRVALTLDGAGTGVAGALLAALAGVLDEPLGLPAGGLLGVGLFLVLFGAAVLFLGTRPAPARRGAVAVVVVNVVWVLDSVLVVAIAPAGLTAWGTGAILFVAAVVAAFAAAQLVGLRRG